MGASFLISLFLGWWFRPFVMETHRPDGSFRRQFTVCRDWRGGLVSHGKQTWVFPDGKRLEKTSFGAPLDKDELKSLLTNEESFDVLIELIIETIEPQSSILDSSLTTVDLKSELEFGRGQVLLPDEKNFR